MKAARAVLSLRSEDQMTSAGDDTFYELFVTGIDSLFMSIDVLAIARNRRGLC
jgi:hypothetical protein